MVEGRPSGALRQAGRLARSAAGMPLHVVSDAAGTDPATLRQYLQSLPTRGSCAQEARSDTADERNLTRVLGLEHPACPPATIRCSMESDETSRAASVSGTAAWAGRYKPGKSLTRGRLLRLLDGRESMKPHTDAANCVAVFARAAVLPRGAAEALLAANNTLAAAAAANPSCPADLLARISYAGTEPVRQAAATNPDCPAFVLRRMAASALPGLRAAVAANPATPAHTLNELAAMSPPPNSALAQNPACPHDVLARLAASPSPDIRTAVAANPSCPPRMLTTLAGDDITLVRHQTASNPSTPSNALRRLTADRDARVVHAAAANPDCPPDDLARLASSDDTNIRVAVAANHACPPTALAVLGYEGPHSAGPHTVTARVAGNPSTPAATIKQLAAHPSHDARVAAAANPSCDAETLEQLVRAALDAYQTWQRTGARRRRDEFQPQGFEQRQWQRIARVAAANPNATRHIAELVERGSKHQHSTSGPGQRTNPPKNG